MAKRKAKKNSSFGWLNILIAALGISSGVVFATLPMIKATLTTYASETVNMYSGIAMIFGGEATNNWTTTYGNNSYVSGTRMVELTFNTMAFIALVLVVLGSLLALATHLSKVLSKNKFVGLFTGLLLLAGGILMVTIRTSCLTALDINEHLVDLYSLAYGAIVAGIIAMVAGISSIAITVLKK